MSKYKILYLDTETTGLDCKVNGIIQLAGIIEIDDIIVEEFNFKLKPHPNDKIDDESFKINNITQEIINFYPEQNIVYEEFIKLLDKYCDRYDKKDKFYPAGYNINFDLEFIKEWFLKNNNKFLGSYINWNTIDPRVYFNIKKMRGELNTENLKLETLCKYYKIEHNKHDALSDIRVTRELIKMFLGDLK